MEDRWIVNKLGLINFWYYDEEEFELSDGKLLLRGANGSGKSVTMQSFIPLLLDGNKRPERLDPFGTNARRIENYLLVDEDETERTAYLYMEFKKRNSEMYLTVGMGLKAVKGKNVDAWYFIINDGRRIKKDFNLYIDKGYEKTVLTKKELQNRVEIGGFYTESQGKYKEKVNEYLFGYSDIESYEELVDLLISIRSPKLSKDFKPTAMYEILENSLRQLTEDDLRPMSEAMENMDNIKARIEQLETSLKAAKHIDEYFNKYNSFILNEKALKLQEKSSHVKELEKARAVIENDIIDIQNKLDLLQKDHYVLQRELDIAQGKIEEYKDSDILKAKDKLEAIKIEIENLKADKKKKDENLDDKKRKLRAKEIEYREKEDSIEKLMSDQTGILENLDDLAQDFSFKQHEMFRDDLNISFIKEVFLKHKNKLANAKNILYKYERTKEEFENTLRDKDRSEVEMDKVSRDLNEALEYLTTVKEEHIEKLTNWNKANQELKLDVDTFKETARSVMGVSAFSDVNNITKYITAEYNNKNAELSVEQQTVKRIILDLQDHILEIETKIEELKAAKEIEFERTEEVKRNREALKNMGIPFIPFYKAIDFSKNLNDEEKKNIESAMVDMGILDALVIPENYRKTVMNIDALGCDKYLFSSPDYLNYSLTEYLTVDKAELKDIGFEKIDDVLKSIMLDEAAGTYVDEKGNYGIGILRGRASSDYELKYIGATARKQHRQRLIEDLNKQIDSINEQVTKEQSTLDILKNRANILKKEYFDIPLTHDLSKAIELIDENRRALKEKENEFKAYNEKYLKLEEDLREVKILVYQATEGFDIERSFQAYEAAEESSRDYGNNLSSYELLEGKIDNTKTLLGNIKDSIEELISDIDDILYDLNIKNKELEDKEKQKQVYEELLLKHGYEEIKEELDKCYNIAKIYPDKIRDNRDKSIKYTERLDNFAQKKAEKEEEIKEETIVLELVKNIFQQEYELGYVTKLDGYTDISKLCNEILKVTQQTTNKSREDFDRELYDSFSKNLGALRDYQPKQITIFRKDGVEDKYKYIIQGSERKDIRFRVDGREVNFNVLLESIKANMEENKLLLSDKEREFFKDILLKTISNKIRSKIYYSKQWVKKMDELMQSMNTSSSFKLNIKWVAKKAENEGQLDTEKLVEILQKEDELIRPEDIEELSMHFSAKVKEIIRDYEDRKENRNYFTVIKEILDYRKWFEFKLYSKKEGEKQKELTNNAFFQLSGGEKAMAMYIPLFTAVYSRYDIADKKDCPRIISLDEAFAGVDDANIRDMFRILREMELDYIFNSQVLWGDYDTVESLSICEIVRPDNADYVAVIRYLWNGKEKLCLA